MRPHKVIYNAGDQQLKTVPVDHLGRPIYVTSGTYAIEDLRVGKDSASNRMIASGDITFGGIDHALTVAAGPSENDDTMVTVADVAPYKEGETYLLDGPDKAELFVLDRKDSANNRLYATQPLRNNYASTTTKVRSVVLECTFPGAEAADESNLLDGGPYTVTWRFESGDRYYSVTEPIFISRYTEAPFVAETDVIAASPTLARRSRDWLKEALARALEDYVLELEMHGRDPSAFHSKASAKNAVVKRACSYLHRWQNTETDLAHAEFYDGEWRRIMGSLLTGVPPHGTVTIDPYRNSAPAGSDKLAKESLFRRS